MSFFLKMFITAQILFLSKKNFSERIIMSPTCVKFQSLPGRNVIHTAEESSSTERFPRSLS